MTATYVTQCPHCSTRFRVTPAHLTAAHGTVRCGVCLETFNANEYLEDSSPLTESAYSEEYAVSSTTWTAPSTEALPATTGADATAADAPAESGTDIGSTATEDMALQNAKAPGQASSVEPTASNTLLIHDDLDLDGLDLDEELAKLDALESAQRLPPLPTFGHEEKPSRQPSYDESWAEALLREEEDALRSEQRHEPTLTLESIEDDASPEPALGPVDKTSEELPQTDSAKPILHMETSPDEHDAFAHSAAPKRATDARAEPGLHVETLLDLHDEPLQLDWQPPKKSWGKRLGWIALNIVALLALVAQYIGFHFDELARQDQYRPWFIQFCASVGCKVPSKVDVKQIRSSNLVVRSHPEFPGALQVDAILYNRATFSQPFPLLELRFADLNGQLLASRRFKPWEYLGGELKGQTEMPPQTPIHISLDILDPGSRAVNYSLSFHSPE
ncbi:putative Zn finger-like uncharacterized protein [Pseudomonas duriflava]|uniref:Putative Zn finger-like uncharacterized protein n=1 Tax=Pseudomonas duriflava TaxID=459528 RepID=A0A562QNP5_9PSED|nr:DUF3426 domain-containing protein [Pseudomonas duriflava]TWI58369.1 putative Zn finger-like uncharacterized protein [Pseudomonas duriflava]